MLDFGFVLILTLWSAGIGLRIMRWLCADVELPADSLALAVPLGLGSLALATLGLGEMGWLTTAGLAVVLAVGAVLGGQEMLRSLSCIARTTTSMFKRPSIFDLALAAVLLGTLLTALAPVTDGDALCYHLQVPKVFLAHRAVVYDPDLHETVYPLVTEMLYAVALAFRGPVACRLLSWVLGVVFAANVTALARPALGDRARWAGAIALLVPAISNGMAAPLNDVALAAFGNAALVAWTRWLDRPSGRAAAFAGLMAGLAVGVKYPGLVLSGLIGVAMLAHGFVTWTRGGWWGNRKTLVGKQRVAPEQTTQWAGTSDSIMVQQREALAQALIHSLIFAGVTLLIGACWYLRAWVFTGNPVYPFFRQTFGGSGIDAVLDPARKAMPVSVLNLLTALATMTLQPQRFESVSHQLGPAFLLFLPGLFLVRAPRRVWALAAMGWIFLTLCLTQRQSMRFVLIAVGPMSVAIAWLATAWWDRRTWPARILVAMMLAMLAFEASVAFARARHGLSVVLGRESEAHYLSRREPTYRVGRWVAEHLPASARLVGQDHRGFYLPRPYTMELAHRRRTGLGTRGESAEVIVAHLRQQGFTHLLLCPPVPETALEFDPTLSRRLDPWLSARAPLYKAEIADADGVVRRFAIYDLQDESPRLADFAREVRR
jgi:Dolichyl-phosphate-mannose-protein mannosyltransferase